MKSLRATGLYDSGKRHGFFHAIAELKQTAQTKIFNVTNINKKVGPTKYSYTLATSKLISLIVKITTIWATPSILTMFYPLTLLKITNDSLYIILSF